MKLATTTKLRKGEYKVKFDGADVVIRKDFDYEEWKELDSWSVYVNEEWGISVSTKKKALWYASKWINTDADILQIGERF